MRADTGDVLEALGVGLLTFVLLSAAFRAAESGKDQGHDRADDRPDCAILDDCDLQALADGDTQTVQTRRGELVRLAAVEEGGESGG